MAKVIFEYKDESGRVHQVSDLKEVPRKYMQTMTAIGVDETEGASAGTSAGASPSAKPAGFPSGPKDRTVILVPVVLLLIVWKMNNFLIRCLAAAAAGGWIFFHGYDTFMSSSWAKTDVELQSEQAEKLRDMQIRKGKDSKAPEEAPPAEE